MIDAHHHLWDLRAVHYPWLMDPAQRFFGDPAPIRRNYRLPEFRADAEAAGGYGSVHIQVGAEDGLAEAQWVQAVCDEHPDWDMRQVVFCDLTRPDLDDVFADFAVLPSVVGIRQIVGRAPEEDMATGTNDLLRNPAFVEGLKCLADRGWSFDLQLIPELMPAMAQVIDQVPGLNVALCHAGSPYDRTESGLAHWAALLRNLSSCANVVCKISGLGMFDHGWTVGAFRPIVSEVLGQFGADRVMFGSNFPVCSLTSDYATLAGAMRELVPEADHPAVFEQTAQAFYFKT
ncbi:MAG: amidohydrolase family protein [Rhodobacteraceae bacterium]|nr:amidohydrolase family protein [Paracoccaceae bacterium]